MKILYVSFSYVPSRRASSVHVMKMSQALAMAGHSVTLITKKCRARQEPGVIDDFGHYGVEPNFSIVKLPRPQLRGGGVIYLSAVLRRLLAASDSLIYTRDPFAAWLASRLGRTLVFEQHGVLSSKWINRLIDSTLRARSLQRLVLVSSALEVDYRDRDRVPRHGDILVAHDGADPPPSVEESKPRSSRPRIGYVGSFYPGKGVDRVVDLARRIPEGDFEIVGGDPARLAQLAEMKLPPNLKLAGFFRHADLHDRYLTFDVLLMPYGHRVLPTSGDLDISRFMSPLKMFEYMASGRAILSSDLPVLREVLEDGRNAILVPPGDEALWEKALRRLIADPALRQRLGESARSDLVHHYTWAARAHRVLDGI